MGPRIAEVDQQPIAEVLGDMPLKALDDFSTPGLIGPYDLAEFFGVQLCREGG
jgi:hypothetical protein